MGKVCFFLPGKGVVLVKVEGVAGASVGVCTTKNLSFGVINCVHFKHIGNLNSIILLRQIYCMWML